MLAAATAGRRRASPRRWARTTAASLCAFRESFCWLGLRHGVHDAAACRVAQCFMRSWRRHTGCNAPLHRPQPLHAWRSDLFACAPMIRWHYARQLVPARAYNWTAPLISGALDVQHATNFALYTSTASAVRLVLFSHHDLHHGRTTAEIPLDPVRNRTGNIWHIAVPDIARDHLYGAFPCVRNTLVARWRRVCCPVVGFPRCNLLRRHQSMSLAQCSW